MASEKVCPPPRAGASPLPEDSDTIHDTGSSSRTAGVKMEKIGQDVHDALATPAGKAAGTPDPDPMSQLPKDEADILRRQIENPERSYGPGSLFRYAKGIDVLILTVSSVAAVASGAALPSMTIIFGGIQNTFQDFTFLGKTSLEEFKAEMVTYVLYFVYIAVGTFAATYVSNIGFVFTGERISTELRQRYLESCLRQNIGFFDKTGSGAITVKVTSDTHAIQQGISGKLAAGISSIATLVTGLTIGFIFSWKLTLIVLATFVALVLNTSVSAHFIIKYGGPAAITFAQACGVAEEAFAAIRVATAFGNQRRLVEKYDEKLKTTQKPEFKLKMAVSIMLAVINALVYLNYGLGFWQGSTFLRKGELDLNQVVTTLMAVMTGSFNVGAIGPNLESFIDAAGRNAKLLEIIDRDAPIDYTDTRGLKPAHAEGHLRLEEIKLIYPSRPDVTVIKNLSLDFPAGKTTAVIGPSGSGKSSIIGLIERFYSPVQGRIYLDGHDISTLNLKWLRRQIALVGQEPVLFATSVFENIRNGLIGTELEHLSDEEQKLLVESAAKQANAHDFITLLPDGYQTDVGGRGLLLSGGQQQRIAIARAVISNPQILLLDEATSALDTKSEAAIQVALKAVSQGRTTITIAHRLSTIRDAHNIIFLSQGRIVEQGNHQDLVDSRGAYRDLISTQNLATETAETKATLKGNMSGNVEPIARHTSGNSIGGFVSSDSPDLARSSPHPRTSSAGGASTRVADSKHKLMCSRWSLLKFVYSFNRQEWALLLLASLTSIVCGLANPVQSVFFAKQMLVLIQFEVPGINKNKIQEGSDLWSLMYLMLGIVQFIAYAIQGITFAYCGEQLMRRIREQTLAHLLRQDIAFFDKGENNPGALSAFVSVETMQVSYITGTTLSTIIIACTNVFAGVVVSLAIGWKLALVCFSLVPLLLASGFFQYYILYQYQESAGKAYADSAGYAAEYVSAMPTVASLTLEEQVITEYRSRLKVQKKKSLISVAKSSALLAASHSMIYLCLGLGFWYGSTLMATREYNIFQFFICLMSVIFGSYSAGTIFTLLADIVKAQYSAAQVKEIFERQPEIDTWSNQGTRIAAVKGRVELRNVHFHYATRPERPVLRGLDLVAEPGQHVALFGPSGCGKSTTIALLERFYDPVIGQVMVDGQDISELDINLYRSQIALVSQHPTLYQGTIRENICMGKNGEVSDEQIENACRDANIHDFIVSLPAGLNTLVGIGGALLSGGQKQRIAIARALIRSPRILLLDEATSALDSESEHIVQAALDRASKGRTTITVAHRISTIRNADVVYVIDQGRVVESGQHSTLMNLNGSYAELVRMQSMA